MTGADPDIVMGRAIAGDGLATVVAPSVGGSPTTYAENIGVMAATRIYSTAAYNVAAVSRGPGCALPNIPPGSSSPGHRL